jgi:hypothetical protein
LRPKPIEPPDLPAAVEADPLNLRGGRIAEVDEVSGTNNLEHSQVTQYAVSVGAGLRNDLDVLQRVHL